MNTIIKILIFVNFISLIFCSSILNKNKKQEIDFILDDPNKIIVDLTLGQIEYSKISQNNQEFIKLKLEDSYYSNISGNPELPQINNLIELPLESSYYIEIIKDQSVEYDLNEISENMKIFPSQPSVSKSETISNIDFSFNESIYSNNEYIHSNLVEIETKGKMREIEIGNLIINPFEYNPVQNKLIIHSDIKFIIHFENTNINLSKEIKERYFSPYFETIFTNSLVNYNTTLSRNNDFIEDKVTYLIIANQSFEGYLDDFIQWKTQKGFNILTAYTNEIGSSASSIRAYIQEQYLNPPNNLAPISFVLIVGDTQQIPASYSSGGHVSDLDYCDMGDDNIPDVLCGRFSAETPMHLLTQIDKTIQYEKYEFSDPSFLQDVILISGVDASYAPTYGNGQINYGNEYYFNSTNNINSQTFLYPESGNSATQILNLANQGASFINYTAHGYEQGWADPSFVNNDVDNMTNNNKYPTMVGNCCLTSAFDTAVCFGESLLRKNGGGAIGYIGGSDVTYWNEDYWWGVGQGSIIENPSYSATGEGAYDGMFHDNSESNWAIVNGAISMVGNLAVAEANGMDDYYWEIYHLMGDPSLSTYIGIPSTNIVEHPVFIAPGSSDIIINAEPLSYVGLTKDNELVGSGLVNELGIANISLTNINDPGEIIVTVTGQNLQPYFGNIILSAPDGPYVTVNDINVNLGNDNIISIGETFNIDVTLENVGSVSAYDTNINLAEGSNSEYISILNGFEQIDEISEGSYNISNFEFTVSNNAPYGHSFNIEISINFGENSYQTNLDLNVENLKESFESGNFNDLSWQFGGNANWIIDSNNSSDGIYSAKSGSIGNNTQSELVLNLNIIEDGIISFSKKVSCESPGSTSGNYYDYLAFYIDGDEQNKWAGEISWSENSYSVMAGDHSFKWVFIKDQDSTDNVDSGQDAVWIDNIILPPLFNNNSMLGDINEDLNINIQDIVLLVNIILYNQNSNNADVNLDGNINVLDIIQVVNIILEN